MSTHFLNETHAKEYDDEPDYYQMLDLQAENEKLKSALRELLKFTGDGRLVKLGYEALGEKPPSLRKLKARK